ncbi:MAG: cytochrome P450 [Polyangia bacterium]
MKTAEQDRSVSTKPRLRATARPPGPGALETLLLLPRLLYNPVLTCRELTRTYGGIVRLNLGVDTLYLLGQPEHAEYVLRERDEHFGKGGKLWAAARPIFGVGLATSEGGLWLRQRRLMQPQFTRSRFAALGDRMIAAIQEELVRWPALAAGEPFNLTEQIIYISMRIFLRTLFDTGVSDEEREELGRASHVLMTRLHYITWGSILPKWFVLPGTQRASEALELVDRLVFRTIEKRHREAREPRAGEERSGDLLAQLLAARDEQTGERMSDRQIRDEAVTLILSGYETTATTIIWSLYQIARRPEVERKLLEEIDQALGKRTPTFDDTAGLSYVKMVISETLRFHSTAWMTHRVSTVDEEIGGFRVPADSLVIILIDSIHHNPTVWEDPDEFRPERFSTEASAGRSRAAFIPFGMGPHQCIGNNFALIEATLVLVMLLQRYRIKLVSQHEVEPLPRMIQKPGVPVMVRLEPR